MCKIQSKLQQFFCKDNNETKMKNILSKVQVIFDNGVFPVNYSVVFDIVKILADNINYRNNKALLDNEINEDISNDLFYKLQFYANEVELKTNITIELGKHPVLSNIWNAERQIDTLRLFSDEEKNWTEDKLNHYYDLYLPMGLTVINNGYHSINAGIIKGIGSLCFSPNDQNRKIYDLSPLYEKIVFDGTYYREINTRKIIKTGESDTNIFELGCIYEIGRIIHSEAKKGKKIYFPSDY